MPERRYMLDYFVSENILGQVSIQLEMASHDWSRLKASAAWMQVEQILMESEKQNSHCFRHNQTGNRKSRQEVKTVDDTKKEMDHLRKQIRSLGTALVLTQVTMITLLIIWSCQYLQLLRNYQDLLQSMQLCLESVETVYSVLQQFLLTP